MYAKRNRRERWTEREKFRCLEDDSRLSRSSLVQCVQERRERKRVYSAFEKERKMKLTVEIELETGVCLYTLRR